MYEERKERLPWHTTNGCPDSGITPLHIACGFDHVPPDLASASDAIQTDPESINTKTCAVCRECSTPLHAAAHHGSLEIVELLIRYGANTNAEDGCGSRALDIAVDRGDESMIICLLDAMESSGSGKEVIAAHSDDQVGRTVFHHAAYAGHADVLKFLLVRLGNVQIETKDYWGCTLLLAACKGDDIESGRGPIWSQNREETILLLLVEGTDPFAKDREGMSVLHCIASYQSGAVAIATNFLQRGVSIDTPLPDRWEEDFDYHSKSTALHIASHTLAFDMVKLLLSQGADPRALTAQQRTPLHLVCNSGRVPGENAMTTIRLLLEAAPDLIDAQDRLGRTPLLSAATTIGTTPGILKLLHERGGDITAVTRNGENVLHLIAASCYNTSPSLGLRENIQYAVQHGVDVEAICNDGLRPLHCAAFASSGGVLEALLQNGADVNALYRECETALHVVYQNASRDELGKILMDHGADVGIRDKQGRKAGDPIPLAGRGRGRGRGGFGDGV